MYENKGYWVYYNGELYHAGVKGMQWGKHLPGTDWWKETTSKYLDSARTAYVPGGNKVLRKPTFAQKVIANLKTAGQAAKIYGRKTRLAGKIIGKQARAAVTRGVYKVAKGTSKLWNKAKGFSSEKINELREFARKAYAGSRNAVHNFFTISRKEMGQNASNRKIKSGTPLSHLDVLQNKQLNDACKSYVTTKMNSSFGNNLNYWFQNAQYGIVKGVNNYLKKFGLDDEVDSFISRISGRESAYGKNRRLEELNSQINYGNIDSKQQDLEKRRQTLV